MLQKLRGKLFQNNHNFSQIKSPKEGEGFNHGANGEEVEPSLC
jgi:hypothetical protein